MSKAIGLAMGLALIWGGVSHAGGVSVKSTDGLTVTVSVTEVFVGSTCDIDFGDGEAVSDLEADTEFTHGYEATGTYEITALCSVEGAHRTRSATEVTVDGSTTTTTTLPGGTTTTTLPQPGVEPYGPIRPTTHDISLKNLASVNFYRGRQATEGEKDALIATALSWMPTIATWSDMYLGGCGTKFAEGQMSIVNVRFTASRQYDNVFDDPKDWCPSSGSGAATHYGAELFSLRRFQGCALMKAEACAASAPSAGLGNILDVLDLRVEDGRCVQGAAFEASPTSGPYDGTRAHSCIGSWDGRVDVAPVIGTELDLLLQTDVIHADGAHFKMCLAEHKDDPSVCHQHGGSVGAAHIAFEATCAPSPLTYTRGPEWDEPYHTCLTTRRIMDFRGDIDPRWSVDEVGHLFSLADRFHAMWTANEAVGDVRRARKTGHYHAQIHRMLQHKGNELYIMPCHLEPSDPFFGLERWDVSQERCPKVTSAQYLAQQFPE